LVKKNDNCSTGNFCEYSEKPKSTTPDTGYFDQGGKLAMSRLMMQPAMTAKGENSQQNEMCHRTWL